MEQQLQEIVNTHFHIHPFSQIPDNADFSIVMANWLALSQAFPYILSGSQKEIILKYIELNQAVPQEIEMTTIMQNFLAWDETGGLYHTLGKKMDAYPNILKTREFHVNLLREDCQMIFKRVIPPDYSTITKNYIMEIFNWLSSMSSIKRVAFLTSFESHANPTLDSLWNSVVKRYHLKKENLPYFSVHVGGPEAAEPHHKKMTETLINKIVPSSEVQNFMNLYKQSYEMHFNWCQDVVNLAMANAKIKNTTLEMMCA